MIREFLARLWHILMPCHPLLSSASSSTSSSDRPAIEDPSKNVAPEVIVALPGLARLPLELLLLIIQYLPAESAAVVALVSKYHYLTLKQYILTGLSDTATRRLFLRLLEVDLPEYIACYCCATLYRWKESGPRYDCPRRYSGIDHLLCPNYCHQHNCRLSLEAVAVFLRGYERGPAYGPQLQELHHKCDGSEPWNSLTPDVSVETAARVVDGKLLLRTSSSLQVPLQQSLPDQLHQLSYIGCCHSAGTLPALVMDAIGYLGSPLKEPRCSDYINCAVCATDLRVAVRATKSDQLVAQITIWQCYGGRDIDQEDKTVRKMFGHTFAHERECRGYPSVLSTRNLELQYNESLCDGGSPTNGLQQRHRWLHWWDWGYYKTTNYPLVCSYNGPDHMGRMLRYYGVQPRDRINLAVGYEL